MGMAALFKEGWAGLRNPSSNPFISGPLSPILPLLLHIYSTYIYLAFEILSLTPAKSSTIREFTIPGSSLADFLFSSSLSRLNFLAVQGNWWSDLFLQVFNPSLQFISASPDQPPVIDFATACKIYLVLNSCFCQNFVSFKTSSSLVFNSWRVHKQ